MEVTRIYNQSLSVISVCALRCAVELKISDHIEAYGCPMPLQKLARSIPIPVEKEVMLDCLMELLVHQGFFAKSEAGYLLTPISELMLTEGSNLGTYVCFITESFTKHFFFMSEWFKDSSTSNNVYQMAHDGKQYWDTLKDKPELANLFNEAMASDCKELGRHMVANYPEVFDGVKNLVDVAGGTGTMAQIIADAFPKLRCTVFDLPHVVEKVPKSDSINVVCGDMFEKIPQADAILIKHSLHNWSDEDCVRILKRCKEAIASPNDGGKVIIMDMILDEEMDDPKAMETKILRNLLMISAAGAKERTKKEWHGVIIGAGYSRYKIYPARMQLYSVIELYP